MFFTRKELFYKYPGRLTWLCAEALGKFVSSILMNLVVQKKHHLLKEFCEYLQDLLHCSLPESIADEMKIRILQEYEKTYIELSTLYDSEDDYQEIATEIFIAILHPSVTRIECIEYTCHPKLLDWFKMRYSDLVYSAICKLKNVRILRIGEAYPLNNRRELGQYSDERIAETLQEFCCGLSSNQEIRTLCEQCKKLRILDFGDSLDVYEESVPYILKMECLEELDVHYTSINSEGFNELLNGFVKTKHSDGKVASECLRKLVCNILLEEQVFLVGNKFPNLVSLTFSADCELTPLKALKHLKYFHVQATCYNYIRELLSCIGGQLVCFKMKNIPEADLNHVATTCVSLNCLHLENSPMVGCSFSNKMYSVPEFPKILNLELNYYDDTGKVTQYLISRFINVRKLFLSSCDNDDVFDFVLERKFMKNLEIAFFEKYNDVHVVLQFFEKYAVITDFPKQCSDDFISVHSVPYS